MKEEVAEKLAHTHYRADSTLTMVRRLLAAAELEQNPEEPIKLLEVNESATADGIIPVPFAARPETGIIYPSLIIEITPDEYADIVKNPKSLPNGWTLGDAIEREVAVN